MRPADYPLDEFLGDSGLRPAQSIMNMQDIFVQPGTGLSLPHFAEAQGYRIAHLGGFDVVAVDASGDEAGFYSANSLIVHEGHRGKGLAVALALWAHQTRTGVPASRKLSDGGRAALTAAWHVSNGTRTSPWWPQAVPRNSPELPEPHSKKGP